MRTTIFSVLALAGLVSSQTTTGMVVSEYTDGQIQASTGSVDTTCSPTTVIVTTTSPVIIPTPTTPILTSAPSSFPVGPTSASRSTRVNTTLTTYNTTRISTAYNITSYYPTAYSTRSSVSVSPIISMNSSSGAAPTFRTSTPTSNGTTTSPISLKSSSTVAAISTSRNTRPPPYTSPTQSTSPIAPNANTASLSVQSLGWVVVGALMGSLACSL